MTIQEALKSFDKKAYAKKKAQAREQSAQLLRLYPRDKWPTMTLAEYAQGQQTGADTYCGWIEHRANDLGSMRGGSAAKLIIYKHRTDGWKFDHSRFTNENKAWEAVRAGFLRAFQMAAEGNFDQVDEIEVLRSGNALRTKTLYLYFPEEILSVYAISHIRHFLRKLDRPEADITGNRVVQLNRHLLHALREYPEARGLDNLDLSHVLYQWDDPRQIDEGGSAIELTGDQMEMLWKRFHRRTSGFRDFEHHGTQFEDEELTYKRRILERYREELGNDRLRAMIDRGEAGQALKLLSTIATSNIVHYTSWRTSFGDTEETTADLLRAFLDVASKPYERPTDLIPIREAYSRHEVRPSWDTYSVTLWVLRPADYFPIKISYYRKLADELGIDLPRGRPGPTNMAKLLAFGRAFYDALEPHGPRDWIDVQSFIWCVRPEAGEEPEEPRETGPDPRPPAVDLPLNQILYGPPGTGKTYSTMRMAVEIIDGESESPEDANELKHRFDELLKQSRIAFVTFHQSYTYEDFVEGIRPVMDEEASAVPRYECRDGIFKKMCSAARSGSTGTAGSDDIDFDGIRFWKMSLGDTLNPDVAHVYTECIHGGYIAHGAGEDTDIGSCGTREEVRAALTKAISEEDPARLAHQTNQLHRFKNEIRTDDLVVVSDGNHKFRAIGRVGGEYRFDSELDYPQTRPVEWLRVFDESQPKERLLKDKCFSQLTLYELQASDLKLDVLRQMLRSPMDAPGESYVLIIDEINRGNISKIFGELITLIEPDKRQGAANELSVILPASQAPFSVPANLYLIGTLNTADKSIALVDTALRRRFSFRELVPDFSVCERLTSPMKAVVTELNRRISTRKDRDHRIGHSYFMSVSDELSFNKVFEDCVLSLLQEYFFTDWEGLRFVLGENGRRDGRFVLPVQAQDAGMARNKWIWFRDAGHPPFDYLSTLIEQYGLDGGGEPGG